MSRKRNGRRMLVALFSWMIAAWWGLMGVLVLAYGMDERKSACGRFCDFEFAIKQYFGHEALERVTAAGCFLVSLLFVAIGVRRGWRRRSTKG